MLKTQIVDVLGKGDAQAALAGITEYRALKVPLPAPLLFAEAKISEQQQGYDRAKMALEEYFRAVKADDANYAEALSLYPKVKKSAEITRAQLVEAEKENQEQRKRAAEAEISALLDQIASNMRPIPAGSFQMGDISGHAVIRFEYEGRKYRTQDNATPVHKVSIKAFALSKYEVTIEQYEVFAVVTGRSLPVRYGEPLPRQEDLPHERPILVSWDDAQSFIAWLNLKSGLRYRLPSESEWEYAARAGSTTDYPWGDKLREELVTGSQEIVPVGSLPPNKWGIYEIIGNAGEWTQDCSFPLNYKSAPTDGSAQARDCDRTDRIVRGWASTSQPQSFMSSVRASNVRSTVAFGFRLARDM